MKIENNTNNKKICETENYNFIKLFAFNGARFKLCCQNIKEYLFHINIEAFPGFKEYEAVGDGNFNNFRDKITRQIDEVFMIQGEVD
jgi:hypothetical protein